jgi:acetolactate synthase I/II/III large subunit
VKVHEALPRTIAAEGVDVVFGVTGDGNLDLVVDLVEHCGVRFVVARHEHGAVVMADGYARASGRVGVCTVTHGPGLTQAARALTGARPARAPVVLVAGDTSAAARFHGQKIDQHHLVLVTAGAIQSLRTAATAAEDVMLAFATPGAERARRC